MKLTNTAIISALCWTARLAAAASATVHTYAPGDEERMHILGFSTLSPVDARLVLAQRAGVVDYHRSDLLREEAIDAINQHGRHTDLFGDSGDKIRNAIIFAERGEDEHPHLRPAFELAPAPASSASRGLLIDLAKQSDPRNLISLSDDGVLSYLKEHDHVTSNGDMFYFAKSMSDFEATYNKLKESGKWYITSLVTPQADASVRSGKEQKFQWGTYEMPGKQAALHKRERAPQEEPLTLTNEAKPVQSFSVPVSVFANNTEPLRGILPACFTTESACQSATRNCTGHGQCHKKYHDPDSAGSGGNNGVDCWSCQCKATKSEDGKKTTVWGGPACQKKDISVQFWLIVLFTVFMIFLVGFAIGSVWEMGSEELPSVIGAGVSGPTARK